MPRRNDPRNAVRRCQLNFVVRESGVVTTHNQAAVLAFFQASKGHCHVWTAPFLQGFNGAMVAFVGCGHVSGLFDAVRLTAGPDDIRLPGPKSHLRALSPDKAPGCPDSRPFPHHSLSPSQFVRRCAAHQIRFIPQLTYAMTTEPRPISAEGVVTAEKN